MAAASQSSGAWCSKVVAASCRLRVYLTAPQPKLFVNAEPGVFITGRVRALANSFSNQEQVSVEGLHFIQEDRPEEVGQAIASWLKRI